MEAASGGAGAPPAPVPAPPAQQRNYAGPRKRRKKRPTAAAGAPAAAAAGSDCSGGEEAEQGPPPGAAAAAAAAAVTVAAPAPALRHPAHPAPDAPASQPPKSAPTAASLRLQKQLASRPTPEVLAERHVLTGSVNADARIRAAQETIYRLLQRDTLARSLRNRASQEELRGSGILREGSLVRERGLRDLLSHFLHTRPNATSLFSREVLKGVLMLWTQLEVWPPPSPRHYHTLTLVGRRVVLLGGLEGGEAIAPLAPVLLDADSGHWSTPRATSAAGSLSPYVRYAHSACAYGRFIIVFAGYSGEQWLNDVWVLDVHPPAGAADGGDGGAAPSPFAAAAAPAAGGAAAAALPAVSMPPGFYAPASGVPLAPLPPWERHPAAPGAAPGAPGAAPGAASAASAAAAAAATSAATQWYLPPVRGTPPPPRAAHTAVRVCRDALMLVFGGSDGTRCLGDAHALALTQRPLRWHALAPVGTPPAPRSGHSALAISSGSAVVIFGGGEGWGGESYNDLCVLDLRGLAGALADGLGVEEGLAGQWRKATSAPLVWLRPAVSGSPPPPRQGHAACEVGGGGGGGGGVGKMLVFGGWGGGGGLPRRPLNDLHVLDLGSFAWSRPSESGSIPSPRSGHAMLSIGSALVVFGGCGTGAPCGDLYSCDTEFREYGGAEAAGAGAAGAAAGAAGEQLGLQQLLPPSTPPRPAGAPAAAASARSAAHQYQLQHHNHHHHHHPAPAPSASASSPQGGSGAPSASAAAAAPAPSSAYVPAWRSSWASKAQGTGSLSAALDALRPASAKQAGERPAPPAAAAAAAASVAMAAGLVQQAQRSGSPVLAGAVGGGDGALALALAEGGAAAAGSPAPAALAEGSATAAAGVARPVAVRGEGREGGGSSGSSGSSGGSSGSGSSGGATFSPARAPAKSAPPMLSLVMQGGQPAGGGEQGVGGAVLGSGGSGVGGSGSGSGNGSGGGGGGGGNSASAGAGAASAAGSGGGAGGSARSSRPKVAHILDAEAVSVSSTKELVALLAQEVAEREREDDAKYEELVAQLQSWRAERRLETSLLFDALRGLMSATQTE